MKDSWDRLQDLFHEARERPAEDWPEFVREACAQDPELQGELWSLLECFTTNDSQLEQPEQVAARAAQLFLENGSLHALQQHKIGEFQIRRFLAAGGMGLVYEAEQDEPRRTVAIKLMRQRLSSGPDLRRFQYEIQLLGRLNHPGIAQIYAAGVHPVEVESGQRHLVPYFAMELVSGARSLTEYAAEESLDRRQRIGLFIQVCQAVHHGHQKSIVHRDLKPANVLVNSAGEPKVIDFGVARALDSERVLTTMATATGQLLGTMRYMSPEQCDLKHREPDTRSDVYALGLILFELLTDAFPYEVPSANLLQAAIAIREAPPRRPSLVDPTLAGNLEVIVLTELRKEPENRYASASELAADLNRWLEDRPIAARSPTWPEQVRRWARRHTVVAMTLSLLLLSLIGGMTTTWIAYAKAQTANQGAQEEARWANELADFLGAMILSPRPDLQGREVLVRDVLQEASEQVDQRLAHEPRVQLRLHTYLCDTFFQLENFQAALHHAERCTELAVTFAQEEPRTKVRALCNQAVVLMACDQLDEAHLFAVRAYEAWQRSGLQDPSLEARVALTLGDAKLHCGKNLAARQWLERGLECLPANERGTEHRVSGYRALATCLRRAGFIQEAIELLQTSLAEVLEFNPDNLQWVLDAKGQLGRMLAWSGRYRDAEPLLDEAIEMSAEVYGDSVENGLVLRLERAHLYLGDGRLEDAQREFDAILRTQQESLGEFHRDTLMTLANSGKVSQAKGEVAEAEAIFREALEILHDEFGRADYGTILAASLLSQLFDQEERWEEFDPLWELVGDQQPSHPKSRAKLRSIQRQRTHALIEARRFETAEQQLKSLHRQVIEEFGPNHRDLKEILLTLMILYRRWDKPALELEYKDLAEHFVADGSTGSGIR